MLNPKQHSSESGQIIIIIAFLMIAIIAMLGLAIDGGGLLLLQRDVQNATDAAIVAGTYATCSGGSDAQIINAARAATKAQGFEHGVDGVTVQVNPHYTGSTDTVKYIQVSINAPKESYFIQIVYNQPLAVTADSVGRCNVAVVTHTPENIRAVVAIANNCGPEENVNVGGSNIHISGGVHSNGDWLSGNSNVWITGTSTIVGQEGGNGAHYNPPVQQGAPPLADPLSQYTFARFNVGGDIYNEANAVGRIVVTSSTISLGWLMNSCTMGGQPCLQGNVLQDGIYVTTKNGGEGIPGAGMASVHGDGGPSDVANVTFVAQNSKIKADSVTFNSYLGNPNAANSTNVLKSMYSLLYVNYSQLPGQDQCKSAVIETGGSQSTWGGYFYAPHGRIMINGSQQQLNGCIIGYSVKLNGSNMNINCSNVQSTIPPSIGIAQ